MAIGTVTDIDGSFSLDIPKNATLSISYPGFLPKEIKVGDKTVFDINLEENTRALDEVVVTGYGVQKKSGRTSRYASYCTVGRRYCFPYPWTNVYQCK
jgi:hypothetical protein